MSREAAKTFEVKIAKGAVLTTEDGPAFAGQVIRVSQADATALARAGTAYAIDEEDAIEASRRARREREAEEAAAEARSRPRTPKLPRATADSTVPIAAPPPLSSS